MVTAAELAYCRVQVPDLDEAERFFTAFGLVVRLRETDRLLLRGYGSEHHLIEVRRGERRILAIGFELDSEDRLTAATAIPGASAVEPIDLPCGGNRVTLVDPDGNRVELVHGMARSEPLPIPVQKFNSAGERVNRKNIAVRPELVASRVLRIGHVVIRTPDVPALATWYRETLGLITSDEVTIPGEPGLLMAFMRLDHGDDYVDHHVLQVLKGGANQVHHISFEVLDIDDLHMGHRALEAAGFTHVWGVGRHLQGSQIFDYWLDPFGTMYEHWTDTDMFNASAPMETWTADQLHSPWGPDMPEQFLHQGVE